MFLSNLSVILARNQPTKQVSQIVTKLLRIRPIVKRNISNIKKKTMMSNIHKTLNLDNSL